MEKEIFIFGDASYKPRAHFNRLVKYTVGLWCLLSSWVDYPNCCLRLKSLTASLLPIARFHNNLLNIAPVMLSRNESLLVSSISVFAIQSIAVSSLVP